MSRPRGGYIGFNRVPASSAINSAATGVWTAREAESLKRAGTWPSALLLPSGALLAANFDSGFDDLAQGLTASQTGSGPTRSTAQYKGGTHSLLVSAGTAANSSTTSRILYGDNADLNITGSNFTVEAWVFSVANGLYQGIVCRDNQSDRRNWQLLKMSGAEGNVAQFSVFNTASGFYLTVADTQALPTNQWVHIAAVRDGNVFRLYRDGVQRASANVSAASGTRSTASGPLAVGAINENGNFAFRGYIDEVLVTNNCRYPSGTTFTPADALLST